MAQSCLTSGDHGTLSVMWKTVSEACNLACDYCYYSRCGGKPGNINRIDSVVLEKFVKEYMAISKGSAVFAWQGGEPLLAGLDFFQEVVYQQAKHAPPHTAISNAVQTNGTLIDDEWARFFKAYNFLIGVSLDGPKEIHDARRVTGSGKGSYELVMRGIEYLRKHGVDFNILTVIHNGNVDKAKELMQFYEQEGFPHVQFIPCMNFRSQEIDKPGKYLVTPEQYGDFLCEAFDLWYNRGEPKISIRFFDNILSVALHQEAELCIHRETCPKTLILEQNGNAYPCDFYIHDDYKLGNVGVDSLVDILQHRRYEEFLGMKPKLPEKCKSCDYLKYCHGGCPRNRSGNFSGDKLDVDYFCQSYKQIYKHSLERIQVVAQNIKAQWLKERIAKGMKLPNRNDECSCGSGNKFKKCCQALVTRN